MAGDVMKSKFVGAALTAAALLGLGGCAGMDRQSQNTFGGAVVGSVVGGTMAGRGGVIVGAGAGAVIGNQLARR